MSHPEFAACLPNRFCGVPGGLPLGGVEWVSPSNPFSPLTRRLRWRVRGEKNMGGTAPKPPGKGRLPLTTPLRGLKGPSKMQDDS
jgi:hypothetical protein